MPPLKPKKQKSKISQVNKDLLGETTVTVHTDTTNEDTLNSLADLADAVSKRIAEDKIDNAMSSVSADAYKIGCSTKVTASTDKKAYQGPLNPEDRKKLIDRLNARTATDEDMRRIDESMILDLPFIKAADFSVSGEFNPRPKDPAIRFRWVNNVNFIQGNMMKLMADGFEVASIDDVDVVKTPIHSRMLDGTQIKQYDVVLMKISVLKLMSIYRRNLETAAFKLDSITSGRGSEAAASQSFSDLVSTDPSAVSGYNRTKAASGREPVVFSRT